MAETGPDEGERDPLVELPEDWALNGQKAYDHFRKGFPRPKEGNLWRTWGALTVTVFERRGAFHWCQSDEDGPRWSPWRGWADEGDGVRALWAEPEGG
jgi:hypothetical protein